MSEIPFPKVDVEKGLELKKSGNVKNVIFSEGTYQIEVADEGSSETFWPFIQLDDEGNVSDCFCMCKRAEEHKSCEHLAAGLLEIYKGKIQPLHVRFRSSLWNIVMQIAAKRHGYETKCLKKLEPKGYYADSLSKKKLFWIKPNNQNAEKLLSDFVEKRVEETEETSLKFSNLPQEELTLWKEGRPSHQLQYELSFWSDLAKWLMLLEEEKQPYKISFKASKGALPKEIKIAFKDVSVWFYIAQENWEELIPALLGRKTTLPIYELEELVIDQILYDEKKKSFQIKSHKREDISPEVFQNKDDEKLIDVGDWYFHPEAGFFPKKVDPLLRKQELSKSDASEMLMRYPMLLEKYLQNTTIHLGVTPICYDLYFDELQRFHISAYLFEKGDLQKQDSAQFDTWVFLEGKGFYQLGALMFNEIEKVIRQNELGEFITKHRVWLNQYEGFQTHLTNIECYLSYSLDAFGRLHFQSSTDAFEDASGALDLGEWVYIEGRGFYAKSSSKVEQILTPGKVVTREEVSPFIKSHEEDLEQVKGFFSLKQPVLKSGLEISLTESDKILVKPKYNFAKGYSESNVSFYGDFTYVEKEGFALLPKGGRIPDRYHQEMQVQERDEQSFIQEELPNLRPLIISLDQRLKIPKQLVLKVHTLGKSENEEGSHWSASLAYQSEFGEVAVRTIYDAMKKRKSYLKTEAGLLALDDARFNWIRALKSGHFVDDSTLEITSLEWMRLSVLETVKPPDPSETSYHDTMKYLEQLSSLRSTDTLKLDGLKSDLRPYQLLGVQWLWFLYMHGLSGLLCDEMGLGKTHQAMALLAACMNEKKPKERKFLVVCPTSVIYHWEELLKRFLPKAKVLVFYGIQRSLKGFSEKTDLLLTSYGTLRSERELLSKISFDIAIYDELQIAKNAYSQTHKALKEISARMKLGLTGTPIENRILELHSLFDVILPNYLPNESLYKELFVVPIEKNQDKEQMQLLKNLIKNFVMRRKKEEVLDDLPEKTEEIAYVDFSDEQKRMYKRAFEKRKEQLMKEIKDPSQPLPYMHIFALFNKLKQICDHPALVTKDTANFEKYQSGKWDLFVELLSEARESGQKLVVFSQYLDMLDIIEKYLKSEGIGYAQIRGSTRNRREEMIKFREDPACEVFIGSLQAAGVGIDLVSASVVIHYDRWWNPAKENQATDRVHRIGQSRGVQVFKLVTKGSIEEHIHKLIEKKLTLLHDVVGYDDQDQIKQLNRDELIQILDNIGSM